MLVYIKSSIQLPVGSTLEAASTSLIAGAIINIDFRVEITQTPFSRGFGIAIRVG
jgi:hypothetical protein